MKNNTSFILIALVLLLAGASVNAQDSADKNNDNSATPWLKGVTIGPKPTELSPVLPLKIYLDSGEPIPATLTEDIPITLVAETAIFDPEPPAVYNGEEIPSPQWSRNAAVSWFFVDWESNKNTPASSSQQLALNQMIVTPLKPTGKGAITCHIGRKMRYTDPESGKIRGTFANSSVARDVVVLDITPPTCGLEISVKDGNSGTFWVAENPPDKYPLPKLADVYFTGALANDKDPDEIITVQGIELGIGMVVPPDRAAITVPADSVLSIKVNGGDNYKLNNSKLKFGISSGAGGEPVPLGDVNAAEISLVDLNLPEEPYLFIDASDEAGNRQVLYVALKVK